MKSFVAAAVTLLLAVSQVSAFTSSFSGSSLSVNTQNKNGMTMEYIPSGISKEQWKKMKESEKQKKSGKNLGKSGITTFKSRSFSDWQKAGGKNLFPGKFLPFVDCFCHRPTLTCIVYTNISSASHLSNYIALSYNNRCSRS